MHDTVLCVELPRNVYPYTAGAGDAVEKVISLKVDTVTWLCCPSVSMYVCMLHASSMFYVLHIQNIEHMEMYRSGLVQLIHTVAN